MPLFSTDAKIFRKKKKKKKIEKNTLKSCSEILKFFSCQNGSNRRINVPKCGQMYIKLGSIITDNLEFIMYVQD